MRSSLEEVLEIEEKILESHMQKEIARCKHGGMTFYTFMRYMNEIVDEQIFYNLVKRADKQKQLEVYARMYQMGDLK